MAPKLEFKRALYPSDDPRGPTVGPDVKAVKIAVSRAGFYPWGEFDEEMNVRFAHGFRVRKEKTKQRENQGLAGFQHWIMHITPSGAMGRATLEALRTYRIPPNKPHEGEWAFDSRGLYLYRGFEDKTEAERVVVEIFKWWRILLAYEPQEHYSQNRPIAPLARHENPPKLPQWLDCSGAVLYTCWLAEAYSPDPHYGYSGLGNTNSINDGGFRISESDLEKYCYNHLVLAFYGYSTWDTTHVVAVENSRSIYSMGSEGAPDQYNSIHYDRGDLPGLVEIRAYKVA